MLCFDLKEWPKERVWTSIRDRTQGNDLVAVPFRGKICALGLVDDIKDAFSDNIKGTWAAGGRKTWRTRKALSCR